MFHLVQEKDRHLPQVQLMIKVGDMLFYMTTDNIFHVQQYIAGKNKL